MKKLPVILLTLLALHSPCISGDGLDADRPVRVNTINVTVAADKLNVDNVLSKNKNEEPPSLKMRLAKYLVRLTLAYSVYHSINPDTARASLRSFIDGVKKHTTAHDTQTILKSLLGYLDRIVEQLPLQFSGAVYAFLASDIEIEDIKRALQLPRDVSSATKIFGTVAFAWIALKDQYPLFFAKVSRLFSDRTNAATAGKN